MIYSVRYECGNTSFSISNGKKFGKCFYTLFYDVDIHQDINTYVDDILEKDIDRLLMKYFNIYVITLDIYSLLNIIIGK